MHSSLAHRASASVSHHACCAASQVLESSFTQERRDGRNLLVHYAVVVPRLIWFPLPVLATRNWTLQLRIQSSGMEGVKDMLSEEGKKCWRCGFKIPNGSICPMCGAVNKLAVNESTKKE